MKKTKKPESSVVEGRGHKEFSLELVATTTLHFLGEDRNPNELRLKLAANLAISFLELCFEQVESHKRGLIHRAEILKEFESLDWKPSDKVSYNEGIKFITSQSRLLRAKEYYEAYVKNNWFLKKPLNASELAAALKAEEKAGFIVQWLPMQRNAFETSRSMGLLGLKRKKKVPTTRT